MIDKILKAYGEMVEKISKASKSLIPRSPEREYARMLLTAIDLAKIEITTDYEMKHMATKTVDEKELIAKYKERVDFHLTNIMEVHRRMK